MKKVIGFLLVCFYVNTFGQCIAPTIPTISASSATICSGQSLTLTVVSGSLNSATNWQWYSGGCGSTNIGSGTLIIVNPVSSTSYFARGEGSCVIPGSCASVSVNVIQSPSVIATSTNPWCFGQSNGQISLSTSGPGPFTYNWSNASAGPMLFGLGAGPYTVTVTSSNGCTTYTTINITQPNPLSLNMSLPQTICYGTQAFAYAQATGGTTPYSYTLTNLNTSQSTYSVWPFGLNITPTLTSTATYTAAVIDANGCAIGPQTTVVYVKPALIAIGSSTTICNGDSVALAANFISTGNGGPYTFNWSNMTNNQSINVAASFSNSPATYTVSISDGCTIPSTSATFTVNAAICTGLKANGNIDSGTSFYPNPITDFLVVEQNGEMLDVKIYSVSGQEVRRKKVLDSKTTIDLSYLESGMYYLCFYDKNKCVRTEKVIVQH